MSSIALDLGSSRIKGMLADANTGIHALRERPTPMRMQQAGQAELDFHQMGLAVEDLIRELSGLEPVERLVFSSLGSMATAVDAQGRALLPGLSPLDARCRADSSLWTARGLDPDEIRHRTGQRTDCASLAHALARVGPLREALRGTGVQLLSLRAFLVRELTGAVVEEPSWASRSMLFDLEQDAWSTELVEALDIPSSTLPAIVPSDASLPMRAGTAARLGLAPQAQVILGGLDNCCAYSGLGRIAPGELVNVTGTHEHLMADVPAARMQDMSLPPEAFVFRHVDPERSIVCSRHTTGHDVQQWAGGDAYRLAAAMRCLNQDVAACQADAQGLLTVLDQATLRLKDYLDQWQRSSGQCVDTLIVVGGGAVPGALLQRKADLLERRITIPRHPECGCLGALGLAGVHIGNPIAHSIQAQVVAQATGARPPVGETP